MPADRRGRRIDQARLAQRPMAAQPIARRKRANHARLGNCASTHAMFSDVLNHFDSTRRRKSGILMDVHRVEFLEDSEGVVTPGQTQLG